MHKKTEEQDLSHRLEVIIEAIRKQKADKITDINITKISSLLCKHFLICDAPSTVQANAIANEVEELLFKEFHEKPLHKEGAQNGIWILLDYADIIVHVFQTEARKFYKLEELWADGIIKKYDS